MQESGDDGGHIGFDLDEHKGGMQAVLDIGFTGLSFLISVGF